MKNSDYSLAVSVYTEAIYLDPANHIVYSNRSIAYVKLNLFDKALLDARKCIQLCPKWYKVSRVYNVIIINDIILHDLALWTFPHGSPLKWHSTFG